MMRASRRATPLLLILLWIWVLSVFVTLDMFFNVSLFDGIRPGTALYHGMRRAGHAMVGERDLDAEPAGGPAPAVRIEAPTGPGCRTVAPATSPGMDVTMPQGGFTAWNDPSGKPAQGEYVDGRRDGLWRWNWPDGSKRETREYRNGLLHGKVESFWPGGGKQVVEEYVEGKPHGEWRRWYAGGQPASEEHYESGVLQGRLTHWYESGAKAAEAEFLAGTSVGLVTRWHENGNRAEEGMYLDGKKEGPWFAWDENGRKTLQGVYVGGKTGPPGPPRPPG